METNGGGDTSGEDEDVEEENPDGDVGIDTGIDFVNGSGAALEKYGGNDVGNWEDDC